MVLKNKRKVYVVGVGMTKFEKPGKRDWDYPDMGRIAIQKALTDASVPYNAIEQVTCGYVYGDSTCGQRAVYEVGITGVPIYNVNNNCATGSTALYMAREFVAGGLADCVLAVGFEKMEKGSLGSKFTDRINPIGNHVQKMLKKTKLARAPVTPQIFGNAGIEHMKKYGTKPHHFAKIAEKNHRHSQHNEKSQFRDVYTLDQITNSKKVYGPLTKLQCCPTSDGGAAAVIVSEDFIKKYGLQKTAVEIVGMSMATDPKKSFDSLMGIAGYHMSKLAADKLYEESGVTPDQVQVVELHDCFSANELVTYEAIGLCPEGGAGKFIDDGDNTYGGKFVVNPSGGLISKGHPLGATGLAQCAELCWQLRGMGGKRQVKGAKMALQHNLGLGGACVMGLYRLANLKPSKFSIKLSKPQAIGSVPDEKTVEKAVKLDKDFKPVGGSSSSGGNFKAEALFKQLGGLINQSIVDKVGATYRFDLSSGSAKRSWYVDLKNKGEVVEGKKNADCTIIMKDADFIKLMAGKLNPTQGYFDGLIKIKGNMMLAQKLDVLTKLIPKSNI